MQDGKSSVEFSLAIPLVEMGGKKLKLSTTKKKAQLIWSENTFYPK